MRSSSSSSGDIEHPFELAVVELGDRVEPAAQPLQLLQPSAAAGHDFNAIGVAQPTVFSQLERAGVQLARNGIGTRDPPAEQQVAPEAQTLREERRRGRTRPRDLPLASSCATTSCASIDERSTRSASSIDAPSRIASADRPSQPRGAMISSSRSRSSRKRSLGRKKNSNLSRSRNSSASASSA